MRVAFLTNKSTRVSLPVLSRLAESQRLTVEHVFFYDALSNSSPLAVLREFGLRRILGKILQLVMSRMRLGLNRLLGGIRPQTAFEYAKFHRLPFTVTNDMNGPEQISALRQSGVEVLLCCVCKNILRSDLLGIEGLRCINVHPSLLPKYRGPTPVFWMLFHDETEAGITIHEMTPKIDVGPVLSQASLPLDYSLSESQIETLLFERAAELIEDALLAEAACVPEPSLSSGSYYSYPTAADRRELRRRLNRRKQPAKV